MALGMLPWAVVWHMAWCLWAYSYTYTSADPVLGGLALPVLSDRVTARITQQNAAPFLAALAVAVTLLLLKGNYVRLGLSGVVDAVARKLQPAGACSHAQHIVAIAVLLTTVL